MRHAGCGIVSTQIRPAESGNAFLEKWNSQRQKGTSAQIFCHTFLPKAREDKWDEATCQQALAVCASGNMNPLLNEVYLWISKGTMAVTPSYMWLSQKVQETPGFCRFQNNLVYEKDEVVIQDNQVKKHIFAFVNPGKAVGAYCWIQVQQGETVINFFEDVRGAEAEKLLSKGGQSARGEYPEMMLKKTPLTRLCRKMSKKLGSWAQVVYSELEIPEEKPISKYVDAPPPVIEPHPVESEPAEWEQLAVYLLGIFEKPEEVKVFLKAVFQIESIDENTPPQMIERIWSHILKEQEKAGVE